MEGSFEKTHQRYQAALDHALAHFRALLASAHSKQWKPIQPSNLAPSTAAGDEKGKARETLNGIGAVEFGSVQVHRRGAKGADIVRAVTEVAVDPERIDADDFKGVLQTPEVRGAWDRLVEQANVVELLDPQTRIAKTDFRLGWPANPRDTITMCKTFSDQSTVIDISTSLPRSSDEPAYLRPSPPHVRANVLLLAWCVQILAPRPSPAAATPTGHDSPMSASPRRPTSAASTSLVVSSPPKARITVFWQVNWKGAVFSTHHNQISSLLSGFIDYCRTHSDRIPLLSSYGRGVQLSAKHYDQGQERLTVEYCIVADEATTAIEADEDSRAKTVEELAIAKGRRRLERAVELKLPLSQGWDIAVAPKGSGEGVDDAWAASAEKEPDKNRAMLRFNHASLASPDDIVRVVVTITRLAGGKLLRVNGNTMPVVTIEPRNPGSTRARGLLEQDDGASVAATLDSDSSASTTVLPAGDDAPSSSESGASPQKVSDVSATLAAVSASTPPGAQATVGGSSAAPPPRRPPPAQAQQIAPLLKRSYIYFTSLLQEPEAKWRQISDARGVTVTQLKSIDPTLTIYRAEATFVGVGVWDVFAAISTAGARAYWDKNLAENTLLQDFNDLSTLWHMKTKATWPAVPRDSVVIKTAYKSPTSVHLFTFSTDDTTLFPRIPAPDQGTIRMQVDLRGWSIEALSPTTTQITLIDQTNPRGWTPKSWTPSLLVSQVASAGEFAIKNGGPPVITRALGAKISLAKYEHDKGVFRVEYYATLEPVAIAVPVSDHGRGDLPTASSPEETDEATHAMVECEIRCDIDTWVTTLDLVVDPPPAKVSCLSRHRLASGGGAWVTVEHERAQLGRGEKVRVLVRKGRDKDKEKGSVWVNGAKVKVDVEDLPEDEVKLLSKRRRIKASPIPLDQYPLTGPRLWRGTPSTSCQPTRQPTPSSEAPAEAAIPAGSTPPSAKSSLGVPLAETGGKPAPGSKAGSTPPSSLAIAPKSRPTISGPGAPTTKPSSPLEYALEALARLQAFHVEQGPEFLVAPAGWSLVSEKGTASVYKKAVPQLSDMFPVYRCDKVVEGVTAEELAATLAVTSLRPKWDDRMEKAVSLEGYGHGCSTSVLTTKPAFPFKGRILYVATVAAHLQVPSISATSSTSTVHFIASASFPPGDREGAPSFAADKLNPQSLVEANMLIEGWIMETLDPYSSSTHAIPSTRCTYFSAIEYCGSVPIAFNSMLNSSLPRMIAGLEALVRSPGPLPRVLRPASDLQVEGPLSSDGVPDWEWRLHGPASPSKCLAISSDQSFKAMFFVANGPKPPSSARNRTAAYGMGLTAAARHDLSRAGAGEAASSLRTISSNPDLRSSKGASQVKRVASAAVGSASAGSTPNGKSMPPSPPPIDICIGEIVVDCKTYPSGYNVRISSAFAKEGVPAPLEMGDSGGEALPVTVSAHQMPTPAAFAASLDPTAKRQLHLLRFILPVSKAVGKAEDDVKAAAATSAWWDKLQKRDALVVVEIAGTQGKSGNTDVLIAMVNGKAQQLILLKESQTTLDRWEDDDYRGPSMSISRATRRSTNEGALTASLPPALERPTAVTSSFLATSTPDTASDSINPTPALLSPATEKPEPVLSVVQQREPSPATMTKGIENRSRTGSLAPLGEMLGSFPISHLGASRSYTLRHLVMTALIFFLLGSLLRSLLSPADFFVIPDASETTETRLLSLLAQRSQWREARRLVELRWPLFPSRWDLIVATVRRPSSG